MYGTECWAMRKQVKERIPTSEISWQRNIAGVSRIQKIKMDDIDLSQALNSKIALLDNVPQRRLR